MSGRQIPPLIRVLRDSSHSQHITGQVQLTDNQGERAQAQGWEGSWELTTWGQLIVEVFGDPGIRAEEIPVEIPAEEGVKRSALMYEVTPLDVWGCPKFTNKEKCKECSNP